MPHHSNDLSPTPTITEHAPFLANISTPSPYPLQRMYIYNNFQVSECILKAYQHGVISGANGFKVSDNAVNILPLPILEKNV